jgi:hypothetical protein
MGHRVGLIAAHGALLINVLEILAEGMGRRHEDRYKPLMMMQDAGSIAADDLALPTTHGLNAAATREVVSAVLPAERARRSHS